MHSKTRRARIAARYLSLLLVLASCWQQALAQGIDFIAPRVEHRPTVQGIIPGSSLLVTAKVTDEAGIASVVLHFRERGTRDFFPLPMLNLDGSDHYEVRVDSRPGSAGVEYFFEAVDSGGNALEMYGGDGFPFHVAASEPDNAALIASAGSGVAGAAGGSLETSTSAPASNAIAGAGQPNVQHQNVAKVSSSGSVLPVKKASMISGNTWVWVGLGVLAAAVVAGLGSAGGGDTTSPANDNTGELDIETPVLSRN